jgi:hypothetical protein
MTVVAMAVARSMVSARLVVSASEASLRVVVVVVVVVVVASVAVWKTAPTPRARASVKLVAQMVAQMSEAFLVAPSAWIFARARCRSLVRRQYRARVSPPAATSRSVNLATRRGHFLRRGAHTKSLSYEAAGEASL